MGEVDRRGGAFQYTICDLIAARAASPPLLSYEGDGGEALKCKVLSIVLFSALKLENNTSRSTRVQQHNS